jgi:hypothetical protein
MLPTMHSPECITKRKGPRTNFARIRWETWCMPCCSETHIPLRNTTHSETRGCTTLCKVRLCFDYKAKFGLGLYGTTIMGGWEYAHALAQSEAGRTPLGICTAAFLISCARVIGKQQPPGRFGGHFSWVDAPNPPLQAHRIALNVGLRCTRKNSLAGE